MASILDEIVERKRDEVRRASREVPEDLLERRIDDAAAIRPFAAELARPPRSINANVIAEIKRMSPSAGLIREDFEPVDIARRYHASGAKAISCLTDEPYFGGRLEYLPLLHAAVPLPILRKDFIIDRYQVVESRAHGADAILLIAECLDDATLVECHGHAGALGLSILIEVHSEENLKRVLDLVEIGPDRNTLLGINNRDLTRMETDLGQTARLLEASEASRVPRDWVVAESGIRTSEDLDALRACGVHTVLVGEHLMRQPDPGAALAELLRP
ncbi:MAG: indole-3-glycerol phosphate synthase TrpC [Planctomycetota bacterium]|nr:indole-3-glycerol phosphate synthase TrpC [Planctomycetota bacterium]